ncbi:MAG TPA: hypothetical protein VFQ53_06700 [Kofleriaceae bacterium]|nr:hypothetical protein [Kofleriaceae bacterium]
MIDAQPQHAPDVAPPEVATGDAAIDHEPDPGALPRSRALAAQQAAAAAPLPLSRAARQLSEAASAAVADEAAMPALADALRVMAVALATDAHDPDRPKIADDCGKLADAIVNAAGANADELRAKRADAMLDPALHARERIQSLQRLLPHLRDGELEAAMSPLSSAISLLIQFGDKHAPPRFHTDLYAIESAANKLFTKVQSIANSSSFMHATDALFDPFDLLYRALEQAEPEVEQARALIVALQALEAAITQGRKPNDYAKAATAALDAFCDGLWTLTSRGPYGAGRAVSSIQSPFKRALGYLEETGTVLGGETRSGAESYRRRVDKPEDVEATQQLIERHAPPKPDTREPAPDWIVVLARSAEDWLGAMRQSAHPRMSRPSAKLVEERTLAFRKLLEAAIPTFPAAQQMAWKVSGISECIGRPELVTSLAGDVTEAEAARKALWAQANAFSLQHGPADAEQNLTYAWLAALDRDLAAGIGWGYFKTTDGQQASRLHDKQVDRSVDEWNTPEDKPPPPVTQLQVTTQLLEAARAAVEDPAAMPGLVTALQRFSTVIAAASHDPARTEIAKQCAAMATALAAVQGATPDELRARRGDAIVDPAARIREQLESLRTLQPHLNDPDLDRALDPMSNAFSVLMHFGSTNAPPRFQTDLDLLLRATSKCSPACTTRRTRTASTARTTRCSSHSTACIARSSRPSPRSPRRGR